MVWDYSEANAFGGMAGDFSVSLKNMMRVLDELSTRTYAYVTQSDAQTQTISANKLISTDPPYYDNIGYADLSDFFYVWLRRSLRPIYPNLFATLAVPKAEELVATPYRHGSKEQAEKFFLDGMTEAMRNLAQQAHPAFPVTIYYAFKQSETKDETGTSSTGWETFLEAVLKAGFVLTGTWPMRTELGNRMIGSGTNALASSIVLVCRKRVADAPTISRREFIRELNATLPEALAEMTSASPALSGQDDRAPDSLLSAQDGRAPKHSLIGSAGVSPALSRNSPVAPVDLSQAIIGPGMAIFSQYSAVLEADGSPMRVKTALQLINRFLAEDDFDHDTQFCLHWFEQQGWSIGKYGDADVLARAKGTTVGGLQATGVVESGKGNLRLLKWIEYAGAPLESAGVSPAKVSHEQIARASRPQRMLSGEGGSAGILPAKSVWQALHQLICTLNQDDESAAGALLSHMLTLAEAVRALAYRLYTLCERKGWAEDARAYNELVTAWSAIEQAASKVDVLVASQKKLGF